MSKEDVDHAQKGTAPLPTPAPTDPSSVPNSVRPYSPPSPCIRQRRACSFLSTEFQRTRTSARAQAPEPKNVRVGARAAWAAGAAPHIRGDCHRRPVQTDAAWRSPAPAHTQQHPGSISPCAQPSGMPPRGPCGSVHRRPRSATRCAGAGQGPEASDNVGMIGSAACFH